MNKIFSLTWKKLALALVIFLVSAVLHNLVSAWLEIEEAVFFIIAVLGVPVYLVVAIIYSLIKMVRKKK